MRFTDVLSVFTMLAYGFVLWMFLRWRSPRFHYLANKLSATKGTDRAMWFESRFIVDRLIAMLFVVASFVVVMPVMYFGLTTKGTSKIPDICFFTSVVVALSGAIISWIPEFFFQIFRNTEES